MGLGFGINCERCGDQLTYDMEDYTAKEEGAEYDLCGKCARIVAFDKKLKDKE
jgi:hypothetical protein